MSMFLRHSNRHLCVGSTRQRGRSSLHTARTEEDKVQNRKGRKVETLYAFITLYCIYSFNYMHPSNKHQDEPGKKTEPRMSISVCCRPTRSCPPHNASTYTTSADSEPSLSVLAKL